MYLLQKNKDGTGWVATDTVHNIVVMWQHKKFNDTQRVVDIEKLDAPTMLQVPTILRNMSDWLVKNHPDKI